MLRRLMLAAAAGLILFASDAGAAGPVHRIGLLIYEPGADAMQGLLAELHDRGYVEDQNIQIEYRYHHGRSEQLPVLAAELVALGPELIVAIGARRRLRFTPWPPAFRWFFPTWRTLSQSVSSRAWRIPEATRPE